MAEINRGLDILTEEARDKSIKEIIAYFDNERGEEIGVVAAGDILDFFLQHIGPEIYNVAVDEVRDSLKKQMEGVDFELDLLKKQK
jgi:uncharacterized protein (DUF2164 family)